MRVWELEPPEAGEEAQNALVQAFIAGEVEGAPPPVEHIRTHLNHVFLSGDRAFKLKRATRLPFADFTSAEQRHTACKAEVSVNTMLGSPFYLHVAPVVRGGSGAFRIGRTSESVVEDWIVVMKRFDASNQFDMLAGNGRLTIEHAERAAVRIAEMHQRAPVSKLLGHAADYREIICSLQNTEAEAAGKQGLEIGQPSPFELLDRELARIDPLIEKRRIAGKVRRGHGDLHLRNICLHEGNPTPFDALEFSERLATTDVLYDLAFMLMDMRRFELPRHVNAAMNTYWNEAGEDEEALELLPFFMSLRAAVRMAVAVADGKLGEAEDYRRLALDLLGRRKAAPLLAIGGLSGSGKSAVAREVAPRLPGPAGARILRSDVLRKRALGIGLATRAADGAYAPEKRAEVYRELAARAAAAYRAGASVVADATFHIVSTRQMISTATKDFKGIWLDAPLHIRLARIAGRKGDASDADADVAMRQEEPVQIEASWRRVDACRPVREIAADILKEIT